MALIDVLTPAEIAEYNEYRNSLFDLPGESNLDIRDAYDSILEDVCA